jgi:hypothetical protein
MNVKCTPAFNFRDFLMKATAVVVLDIMGITEAAEGGGGGDWRKYLAKIFSFHGKGEGRGQRDH